MRYRLCLTTRRTLIVVEKGEHDMRVNNPQVVFNVFNALKYHEEEVGDCSLITSWNYLVQNQFMQYRNEL